MKRVNTSPGPSLACCRPERCLRKRPTAIRSKAISIVVPSAPGGTTDFTARLVGEQLSRAWASRWWSTTGPAPAGNIGTRRCRVRTRRLHLAHAVLGYQVGNPACSRRPAGTGKDFTPVAMVTRAPQVVAVRANLLPATSPN